MNKEVMEDNIVDIDKEAREKERIDKESRWDSYSSWPHFKYPIGEYSFFEMLNKRRKEALKEVEWSKNKINAINKKITENNDSFEEYLLEKMKKESGIINKIKNLLPSSTVKKQDPFKDYEVVQKFNKNLIEMWKIKIKHKSLEASLLDKELDDFEKYIAVMVDIAIKKDKEKEILDNLENDPKTLEKIKIIREAFKDVKQLPIDSQSPTKLDAPNNGKTFKDKEQSDREHHLDIIKDTHIVKSLVLEESFKYFYTLRNIDKYGEVVDTIERGINSVKSSNFGDDFHADKKIISFSEKIDRLDSGFMSYGVTIDSVDSSEAPRSEYYQARIRESVLLRLKEERLSIIKTCLKEYEDMNKEETLENNMSIDR